MNKRILGGGLVIVAILLAKFFNFSTLSTLNIACLMAFGAMAWVGVHIFMKTIIPNPPGPSFSIWKLLLNAGLGMVVLILVLVLGITSTSNVIDNELAKYGAQATATVIEKDITRLPAKRGKMNYVYTLTLSFKDADGITRKVDSEVPEYEFNLTSEGMPVKIAYSTRKPALHKITSWSDD